MQRTQSVEGIANGHWERSEPRSAWLLMLARLGALSCACWAIGLANTRIARVKKPHIETQVREAPPRTPKQRGALECAARARCHSFCTS